MAFISVKLEENGEPIELPHMTRIHANKMPTLKILFYETGEVAHMFFTDGSHSGRLSPPNSKLTIEIMKE